MLFRVLRGRLRGEHRGNMPWLFFLAALAIPAFYAVGLLARTGDHFTVTEFWRFWVVHLWVEDFLEIFTTVMVAYMFVLLGVVRENVALTVIFLDILLYSAGGVIGTMHHLYFSGEPAEHMALGASSRAAEVIPLTFLTVEAWSFLQLGAAQESRAKTPFPHRWAVMFLVAVGFWNFLGAGIFGFLVNLPIVSYYEIGTALTANHAHAAMMGVYGMLAIGLALFCLRYLIPADNWPEKWAKDQLLVHQHRARLDVLRHAAPAGDPAALRVGQRRLLRGARAQVPDQRHQQLIEWLRLPGDIVFIVGGAVPCSTSPTRHPPHGQAGDARGAGGHPVHRDHASRPAWPRQGPKRQLRPGRRARERAGHRGASRRRRMRSCSSALPAGLDWLARLTHRRRRPTAPPASPTTRARPLDLPRGGAPVAARVRPGAAARALPREGPRVQRLPGQGALHRLRPRAGGRPRAGPWPHSEAGRFHRGWR